MSQASTAQVPAEIRLVAAVSRLLDFHQSRSSGSSITVPEVPDTAGRNLFLAVEILQALGRIEIEQGNLRVSLKVLAAELQSEVGEVSMEELSFCVASLGMAREIRYGHVGDNGEVTFARTSDTTALIVFDQNLHQVVLTENARLLLRVASLKESWLYSDVDAQRLLKAIERGQFEDVPRFCREMVRDLAGKARQIADAIERPTLVDLRDALITDGVKISETLHEASQLVQSAMSLLFAEQTEEAFALWRATRGVTFSLGNLQAEIEIVLQSTESLSRRFIKFVKDAQRAQTVRAPVMRLLDIARSLTARPDGFAAQVDSAMSDVLPWASNVPVFGPDQFAGVVNLAAMLEQKNPHTPPITFDSANDAIVTSEVLHEVLSRNAGAIVEALRTGPLRFSDLLKQENLAMRPGETNARLVGVFTYPQIFDAQGVRVRVVHDSGLTAHDVSGHMLLTSNPLLSIEGTNDDTC